MTRLIMLGVGGGPRLNFKFSRPAIALEVDRNLYLIDAGYETVKQFEAAELNFSQLRAVFITHRHFDHSSGIPALLLHGWVSRFGSLAHPIKLVGPQEISKLLDGFYQTFTQEITNFELGGGFGTFPKHVAVDVTRMESGIQVVYEDELVIVESTEIFHGPELAQPLAYRFTIKSTGKTVVFSGDVAGEDPDLMALAQNSDVLVHEVQDNHQVEKLAATLPGDRGVELAKHLFEAHTDIERLAFIGAQTGAKKIVFCHYTPIPQPAENYLAVAESRRAEAGYVGEFIAPSDLASIEI